MYAGLFANPGVCEDFSNLEPGESAVEIGKVVWEEGWVAVGGRTKGCGQNPLGGQSVVQQLTGVTVIAIDHAASSGTSTFSLDGRVAYTLVHYR